MDDATSMEVDKSELSASAVVKAESCWPSVFKSENDHEYWKSCKDGFVMARPFPKSIAKELQGSWPVVESAIAKCYMGCRLNLNNCYMVFLTSYLSVSDGFLNGRDVLTFLSVNVPADRATRVMTDGALCDIIRTGHQKLGICTKFGIKRDEYQKRKKLLMTLPEKELAALTGCGIYFRPKNNLVAAIGPHVGLKLARRIVTDCIVNKVPRARRIKDLLNRDRVSLRLEKLNLG